MSNVDDIQILLTAVIASSAANKISGIVIFVSWLQGNLASPDIQ